jgi:hypothetical protein
MGNQGAPLSLKNVFASQRKEAKRDPFRFVFVCSSEKKITTFCFISLNSPFGILVDSPKYSVTLGRGIENGD